ncbi:MAG: PAS domain S-box protein [Bacteroidales bacterium]|nr:PAS domain S-box protein [Bacteroidales bacterium]
MLIKRINKVLPPFRVLRLLVIMSLALQLIVLSQMYFFKSDLFDEPMLVLIRLVRGTILSFLAGLMLAYPYIITIQKLNRSLPWKISGIKRLAIQFPMAILAGIMITPVILVPAGFLFGLEYDFQIIVNNAYYLVILSLFLMVILEAIIYLNESAEAQAKARILEKELIEEAAKKAAFEARTILLANLPGAAYRCQFDDNFTVDYISDKIFDISGYPPSDFKANSRRSYSSIIHPDDVELCRNRIAEACRLSDSFEIEYRIIDNRGEIVWVKENGKCIFDSEGNLEFLDGIIMDISLRKAAEQAAKETERNYKEMLDSLPQPVFELDMEGRLVIGNKAGYEFFGTPAGAPQNTISVLDLFLEEDRPRIVENIRNSAQGILSDPSEFTAIRKDGSLCPVMVFGSPIVRNGKITGRRGIIVDISERKKYETGLLEAKQELESLNNNLEKIVAQRTEELTQATTQLLKVQKENLQSQIEVLKSQINPHFMFNSLNVLSGLIHVDVAKAQLFIDEFSQIYRYVLETIDQPVVTLNEELEFVRSYLFLQQIRYGEHLTWSVNIVAAKLQMLVPPLSLQVLLENAMKHNIVNESKPLKIEIYSDEDYLFIQNPIQPKVSGTSTGLGLKNLIKRYALISRMEPAFTVVDNKYIARIPLIKIDQDERSDN